MTVDRTRTFIVSLLGASTLAIALAGTAHADRRSPAPISFGGQGDSVDRQSTMPVQTQQRTNARAQAPASQGANAKTRKIEFRYPDQPDTFYGAGGARAADAGTSPIAFSSAETALSVQDAQRYTAPKDPAITSGGFDARAEAAKVAEARSVTQTVPIRIASLQVQQPAATGRPLTLSKVRVNRDAKISEEHGLAGVYVEGFNGQPTANGEIFDETAMTAAHPSLPLPSLVQVINETNKREIVVRVNDRGPFDGKRILELSPRAANVLGVPSGQASNVRVRYLGPAPVQQVSDAYASAPVQSEPMRPVASPAPQVAVYEEPNLGVPDPVEAMTPTTPVGRGNVFIQAGSFADIANAQRLNSALGRGLPVKIEEARVRGGDYFRVMIGPFQTRDEAEVQRRQLSQAGITDGFVTTR
jgi:rare lipoprotein A